MTPQAFVFACFAASSLLQQTFCFVPLPSQLAASTGWKTLRTSSCRSKDLPLSGIKMQILSEQQRLKDNPAPDFYYYDYPRFCYHADAEFHAELTNLYANELPYGPEVRVLDMMSSWVSHYPTDRSWGRVDGIGMNEEELERNPQLDFAQVWDLNDNSTLPFPVSAPPAHCVCASGLTAALQDESFDAVTCALSVQYLMYPEEVVADVARVLKPGGKAVFAFSNRMFPSKAVYGWRQRSEEQRLQLVLDLFRAASPRFLPPQAVDKSTLLHKLSSLSTLYFGAPLTGDPFYAVVAEKRAD